MKTCSRCKQSKSPTEFTKHSKRKDGLQSACKICITLSNRNYYQKTKSVRIADIKKRKKQYTETCRQWVYKYLCEHPCIDCEEKNPIVLQFDHVRGNKIADVGSMIHNNPSLKTIQKEIDKCEVRCANCHTKRTAKQFNWWIYQYHKEE